MAHLPHNLEEDGLKAIREAISSSGYPFQARIMREAKDCSDNGKSEWLFDSVEFPVQVAGKDTRIDIVLFHKSQPVYLSIECKRANPQFSRWVFLKLDYRRRESDTEYMMIDFARPQARADDLNALRPIPGGYHGYYGPILDQDRAYHFAVSAKTKMPSEGNGRSRSNDIEDAATQSCRGANGLLQHFATACSSKIHQGKPVGVLPCVVTTAKLYSVDKSLADTNLQDGIPLLPSEDFHEQKWLYYQYPVSAGLRPSNWQAHFDRMPWQLSDENYVRTVAICNSAYFSEFLAAFRSEWFSGWRPISVNNIFGD